MNSPDMIRLHGRFDHCIIGVYKNERHTPQSIAMELEIQIDTRTAARSSRLCYTIDYAKLVGESGFVLETSRFLLLETAADALARYLLAPPIPARAHPRPSAVRVKLSKPAAISDAFHASVEIYRTQDDYQYLVENSDFGTVDIIGEYQECGIYRLNIDPGYAIPTHIHQKMREREMALTDGLMLQGKSLPSGIAHSWPPDFPHRYDNPTEEIKSILCIDCPKFDPADEIAVAAEPRELSKLPGDSIKDYYKIPS